MWIALYINCFSGKFIPYGPFDSESEADEFCGRQDDPSLWASKKVYMPRPLPVVLL